VFDIWGAEAQVYTGYFYANCEMYNSLLFFFIRRIRRKKLKILYYKKMSNKCHNMTKSEKSTYNTF